MKFIAENIIDTVIEEIGVSTGLGLEKFELLSEDQPALAAFITAESNDALTAPEQELLFFTASVIYTAVQEVAEEWKAITTDQIAELEEINWEQMHEVKAGNFRDKITPFFEEYPQEDLLAFVEDMLIDEEEAISREGRDALFIILKTLIDVLHQSTS